MKDFKNNLKTSKFNNKTKLKSKLKIRNKNKKNK